MAPTTTWIILALIVPAVIAALALLIGAHPFSNPSGPGSDLGWIISLTFGFAIACVVTFGLPNVPPTAWLDWLLIVLLPATAIVGIIAAMHALPAMFLWLARFIIAGATAPLMMQSYYRGAFPHWEGAQVYYHFVAIGIIIALVWSLTRRMADRTPGSPVPLTLLIIAVGTGIAITLSGSQTVGQLSLSLAAALAGGCVISVLITRKLHVGGCADMSMILLAGVILSGRYFVELTTLNALLLFCSPLLLWLPELPGVRGVLPAGQWRTQAVRVVLAALPVTVAVALATVDFLRDMANDQYVY